MKWHPELTKIGDYLMATRVTNLLREVGYPTPQYVWAGILGGKRL
jgi:hypothetical protein